MKIVYVSDIHGNYPALQAVKEHVEYTHNPDMVVFLGDVFGVLGSNADCVDLIREWADVSIRGNHDTRNSPERDFIPLFDDSIVEYELVENGVSDEQREWVFGLPEYFVIEGDTLVTHIRPEQQSPVGNGDDGGILKKDIPTVASEYLAESPYSTLVTGHTHEAYVESVDRFDGISGTFVNPGAVGYPYSNKDYVDNTYTGKATYAVHNTENNSVHIEVVEYDSTPVIEFIDQLGL